MITEYIKHIFISQKDHTLINDIMSENPAIKILKDHKDTNFFSGIEKKRKELLRNNLKISVIDLGAGSKKNSTNIRNVSKIARNSLTNAKYCRLLYRTAYFTKAKRILELGTSLGITALYFDKCEYTQIITTVEGDKSITEEARKNFNISNNKITIINSDFDSFLTNLDENDKFDLIFIDGNHTKEATLKYYNILKKHSTPQTFIIFDDIRWSAEMLEAWNIISETNDFLFLDLFKMGMAIPKIKQIKRNKIFYNYGL